MKVLVTGAAGFIGFHVARNLLKQGIAVVGIDNMNNYYDPALKEARASQLEALPGFELARIGVQDREAVGELFARHRDMTHVIHLAAQAGVRYSLIDPYAYIDANVMGMVVLLEEARKLQSLAHFVYASSSSVYGGNTQMPFSVEDRVDSPVSLYAATKRSGELIAHTYAHLYGLPLTGLRYFTVYGPWGRPDMAAYLFTDAIMAGRPIRVFNFGKMRRDFTYIDDIAAGTLAAMRHIPDGKVPCQVYNLGNSKSEELSDFIDTLERSLGREAVRDLQPIQPGDVPETYADIEASRRDLGFEPRIPISEGIPRFVEWYKEYHQLG